MAILFRAFQGTLGAVIAYLASLQILKNGWNSIGALAIAAVIGAVAAVAYGLFSGRVKSLLPERGLFKATDLIPWAIGTVVYFGLFVLFSGGDR